MNKKKRRQHRGWSQKRPPRLAGREEAQLAVLGDENLRRRRREDIRFCIRLRVRVRRRGCVSRCLGSLADAAG